MTPSPEHRTPSQANEPQLTDAQADQADLAGDVNKAQRRHAVNDRAAVEIQAQIWRDNGGQQ